jgi:hypothetical protein
MASLTVKETDALLRVLGGVRSKSTAGAPTSALSLDECATEFAAAFARPDWTRICIALVRRRCARRGGEGNSSLMCSPTVQATLLRDDALVLSSAAERTVGAYLLYAIGRPASGSIAEHPYLPVLLALAERRTPECSEAKLSARLLAGKWDSLWAQRPLPAVCPQRSASCGFCADAARVRVGRSLPNSTPPRSPMCLPTLCTP